MCTTFLRVLAPFGWLHSALLDAPRSASCSDLLYQQSTDLYTARHLPYSIPFSSSSLARRATLLPVRKAPFLRFLSWNFPP